MNYDNIKEIWIEIEELESNNHDYYNDNTDVIVTFTDETRYVSSFVTYKNVETLTSKNRKTGENLNGKYFWVSDMILIEDVTRASIEQVIQDLIIDDSFDLIFKKIED